MSFLSSSKSYWRVVLSCIKITAKYPWRSAPKPNATTLEKLAHWNEDLDSIKAFLDLSRPLERIFPELIDLNEEYTSARVEEAYKRRKATHRLAQTLVGNPQYRRDESFERRVAEVLTSERSATSRDMGLSRADWIWVKLFMGEWKNEDDMLEAMASPKPEYLLADDAESMISDMSDSGSLQDGTKKSTKFDIDTFDSSSLASNSNAA